MNMWPLFALGAVLAIAFSDTMRKLGANVQDVYLSGIIFMLGGLITTTILWLTLSREIEWNPKGFQYAALGGMFIALYTICMFKALETGSLSIVAPLVRTCGIIMVTVLGIFLFHEKLSWNLIVGILLALGGSYLIFTGPK